MRASERWLWVLPVLFVVGVFLIADALWFGDGSDQVRSTPTRIPSPVATPASPTPSPTSDGGAPSPTMATLTPTADATASSTAGPTRERWSFCRDASDVDDLRRAVLRGTKSPRAIVAQAEELEAHLSDPRLDDLKDIVGRLRRAVFDADVGYATDFEVRGWAEALDLVSTTALVQLDCRASR
ncbi:MAG TPA: hypothetical protein VFT27_03170 [Actinomycetota bacterium]|nr:hypothetical protein [Actinomycetota bacterium]